MLNDLRLFFVFKRIKMNNEELYRGIYRVKSIRLPHWDYTSDGEYFVTICTKDRVNFFGEVKNGIMGLNDIGCMVVKFWQEIPNHFNNVKLDEWIVMPNHVHGIIIIKNPTVETRHGTSLRMDNMFCCNTDLHDSAKSKYNQFGPLITKSLSSIINQFKGAVTRWCRKNGYFDFMWPFGLELMVERQPRFYEHIIRDSDALYEIREYIKYNPVQWERDRNNLKN